MKYTNFQDCSPQVIIDTSKKFLQNFEQERISRFSSTLFFLARNGIDRVSRDTYDHICFENAQFQENAHATCLQTTKFLHRSGTGLVNQSLTYSGVSLCADKLPVLFFPSPDFYGKKLMSTKLMTWNHFYQTL